LAERLLGWISAIESTRIIALAQTGVSIAGDSSNTFNTHTEETFPRITWRSAFTKIYIKKTKVETRTKVEARKYIEAEARIGPSFSAYRCSPT
jgi:hypothetical protein